MNEEGKVKSEMNIELLDTVALVCYVPELGLAAGEVGELLKRMKLET